jgi:hypothetical protein
MTMHLARGLTTLNTKKPKKKTKYTKSQIEKWTVEMRQHNKKMRKIHCHDLQMTLDDYIEYIHGRYKPKKKTETVMNLPWHQSGTEFKRTTDHIPSRISSHSFSPCTKRQPLQYTGERKLVGIATMHKSNMVPIFADDDDKTGKKQATEIATMRRN